MIQAQGSRFLCLLHLPSLCLDPEPGVPSEANTVETQFPWKRIFTAQMKEGAVSCNRDVGGKLMQGHHIRLLLRIGMALQIIPMGNSYQREKHEGDKERISNVTTQSHQQKSLNWIFNNFSDVTEGWRQEPDSLPHFWGLQKAPWPRCCLNGGTCILGSFCVCPSHFTGRHCEQDLRRRECGALAHGAWIVLSCRLCRCVYGALHCLSRQTQGFCGLQDFLPSHSDGLNSQHTMSFLILLPCFLLQCLVCN